MAEGDGLSLSLGLAHQSQQLHIHGPSSPPEWIDVNRAPAENVLREGVQEDEAEACSPNSAGSGAFSGNSSAKRVEKERPSREGEENMPAGATGRGASDEEDVSEGSRKKLRLSKEQSALLEDSFKEHNTLNPKQKLALAKQLNLRPRQVEVWFQNRRARTKLKQTEADCETLKRQCESLTEENRRLQKEVQELRALKLSPQFYMQAPPPTTLTMCPSCQTVAPATSVSIDRKPQRLILPRPANAPALPLSPANAPALPLPPAKLLS